MSPVVLEVRLYREQISGVDVKGVPYVLPAREWMRLHYHADGTKSSLVPMPPLGLFFGM